MNKSLLQTKINPYKGLIGQFVLVLVMLVVGVESAVSRINDPKFLAGYRNMFVQNLSTYPDAMVYQITFPYAMPAPTTYYDLVVSINTFSFVDSNTIGWNFTKMNFGLSGFQLLYEAGTNSVIYSLAVNYMIVDNSYPDFEIVYFNVQCKMLNVGYHYRSENWTYQIKRFQNDSNFQAATFLESFNMTNTQVDNLILKNNIYRYNLSLVIQYYTWGQYFVNDFQFTLILYNTAYMMVTNDRTVMVNTWVLSPGTDPALIHADLIVDHTGFTRSDRFFSGVSGLNLTRSGNKTFEFRIHLNNVFTFQFSTTGVTNVDYAAISVFVIRCPSGAWSQFHNDCVATCNGAEFIDYSHTLAFCSACHYSCNTCWDHKNTSCKLCSSTTRVPYRTATVSGQNWYSCQCNIGYYEVYQTDCATCGDIIPGCLNCLNNATCITCIPNTQPKNGLCECTDPLKVLIDGTCQTRIQGCQTHVKQAVTNKILCVECYVQRNFTITIGFGCACQRPSLQRVQEVTTNQFWCNYICGDGHVADTQQCDDNNVFSGDGCSDKCKIQRNFTCINPINQASVCQYNLTADIQFRWAERRLYENTAVLNFTIEPYTTYWDQIVNWSAIVTTSMPVAKMEHDFFCPDLWASLRCNLTLTVQYYAHLENQPFSIALGFSNIQKIKYDSREHWFVPTGNVAELTFEPQQHLTTMVSMDHLMLALSIISLVVMIASVYFDKMIGLETIMTIQFMYYLMAGIENNTIEFIPIQRYLKYSTGFNTIENYTYHSYAPLPNRLNHIYYEKEFILNMNIMLLLLAIAVFVFVVFKLVRMFKQHLRKERELNATNNSRVFETDPAETNRKFDKFYKFYWNNIFFVLSMFLLYQVMFGSIVTVTLPDPTWTYYSPSLNFASIIFAFFIVTMVVLAVCYWSYQQSREKGRMSLGNSPFIPLEFKLCQSQYVTIYFLVQMVKIWTIALFYDQYYCYYIILPICILYFIGLVMYRPYRRRNSILDSLDEEDPEAEDKLCFSIHNFGICFNEFWLIVYIILCIVWNDNNYGLDSDFPQVILYISIPIIFLLNIVAVLRMFYKKLGILFMCDYFKGSGNTEMSYDNDSQKMRKVVRNQNTKVIDDEVYSGGNDEDRNAATRRDRSKILQDVRKAKQFKDEWKDDAKPVYYNNQYPDSEDDDETYNNRRTNNYQSPNYSNNQGYNPNYNQGYPQSRDQSYNQSYSQSPKNQSRLDTTNGNIINNNPDGLIYTNKARPSNYRNPGVVEMETLPRSNSQTSYQFNKSSDKKTGNLNRSVLDTLLDKRQEQGMTSRKMSTSMINNSAIREDRKRGQQDLYYLKQRLRRELDIKNGVYKSDNDYVIKDY